MRISVSKHAPVTVPFGCAIAALPGVALAHGSSSMLFSVMGIPYGAIAYLVFGLVWAFSAPKGKRLGPALLALAGAPVWGLLFIGVYFEYERALKAYEVLWSFGWPSLLLWTAMMRRGQSRVRF